jgi:hypothetical protein
MDNQAFLSSADDEENFAALDSMNPTPLSSKPEPLAVSGSLFDRIRARTEEQQKASQQQQMQSSAEPTMEFEKPNPFDAAVRNTVGAANNPPAPQLQQPSMMTNNNNNETTYAFSGPSDFSSIPTYGPSRNDYIDGNSGQYSNYNNATWKDRASNAFTSIVEGTHSLVGLMSDKMGGRVGGDGRGGYSTNFLLREDGLDGGVGHTAVPAHTTNNNTMGQQQQEGGGGGISLVSEKAYSIFSYGKTFCEDMTGFFMQLPHWGKGMVVLVAVLFVKFLFFW